MKRTHIHLALLCLLLHLALISQLSGRSPFNPEKDVAASMLLQGQTVLPAGQLRHTGVHDAGIFYVPLSNAAISRGFATQMTDPETGEAISAATYPRGSGNQYIFGGAIWVGGLVGTDTLVTVGRDGWTMQVELRPEFPDSGAMRRTGRFADDEFVTTVVDSTAAANPLDIEVELNSYSWADSLYDDFIILDYLITNVGDNYIESGWAGVYLDNDIYHLSYMTGGWADDYSDVLDTLLDSEDSSSRVVIAYSFDNNGDPGDNNQWNNESVQAAVGIALLDCTSPIEEINFNWWASNGNAELDYGPRRAGTPEDPLRLFSNNNLGTAVTDGDKYYLLSHPERDFPQLHAAALDSTSGWIVPSEALALDLANGFDTRFLYSFGPFDLAQGDSVRFVVALAAGGPFHTDPTAFDAAYDPFNPSAFEDNLDVSALVRIIGRADSVYRSGYYLPHPGAPAGVRVTDYDDGYVDLVWAASHRNDLARYDVYLRDTAVANIWLRVASTAPGDTTIRIPVYEPTHSYSFAVRIIDTLGRESELSLPASVIPGTPHPPESLTIELDGAIPVLHWQPTVDTSLQAYLIYRSIWRSTYVLYDSTAALTYRDYGAESGVQYTYKISAINDLGFESGTCDPVNALPMAFDRGVLFHSLNRFETQSGKLYPQKYIDRLYESIASVTPVDRIDVDDSVASLTTMSHYRVVVFEASNLPSAFWIIPDSVRYYLREGGRAVFAAPSLGRTGINIQVNRYGPGSVYHDFLRLDSSVLPGVVISGSSFVGDLIGCESLNPDYPPMAADYSKLAESDIPIIGDIPVSGYLFPKNEVEPLYRYISSNTDTVSHGQINGYRYITDSGGVVVLNFPLVAMKEQDNFEALRQALADLGINMNCGDVNRDGRIAVDDILYLINHVFKGGPAPGEPWRADVVCDQVLDAQDILTLINYIFRQGWLACCPPGGGEPP